MSRAVPAVVPFPSCESEWLSLFLSSLWVCRSLDDVDPPARLLSPSQPNATKSFLPSAFPSSFCLFRQQRRRRPSCLRFLCVFASTMLSAPPSSSSGSELQVLRQHAAALTRIMPIKLSRYCPLTFNAAHFPLPEHL